MSVVGFDIGNETCKIAVAKRRGIEVLQNETGKRKTDTLVAFGEKQRFLGDEATAQFGSNMKSTLRYFKRFLGMKKGDPGLEFEKNFITYKTVELGEKIGFEVSSYDGEVIQLLPEQACAAMLTKLKTIAEAGLENQKVSDCVIGVPSCWSDQQRRALLNAAKITGLNVLRLMNETTAVALNWGILKNLDDKTHKVVFVDMGVSQTSVSVVEFSAGKLQVLATSADHNLGGRDFDFLLMEHFAAYIKEKYKMDVKTDAKAMMKLNKECEKIKLTLSANTKVPFHVEFIMNDRDVSGQIERHEFEKMCQPMFDRFLNIVKKAMELANVSPTDIHACEIIGGGTRVPALQTRLAEFIGKPLSKTCDSDESVSRGCALQCAMLSPNFRVRDFEVQDATAYPINVQWGAIGSDEGPTADNHQTVFEKNSSFPKVSMIVFEDRVAPFQLTVKYVDPPIVLGTYAVSGMPTPEPDKPVPKIKVAVNMDIHGIVSVRDARAHIVEEVVEMKDEEVGASPSKMDTEGEATEEPPKEDTPTEDAAKKEESKETPKKEKKKKVALKVKAAVDGMDQKSLDGAAEKEAQMIATDRAVAATNEARNALEAYILEMRSEVESGGELAPFIEEPKASEFAEQMTAMEDWLYDEGENVQKSEYIAQLDKLKKVGDPVENRAREFKQRPEVAAALKTEISKWEKLMANPTEKDEHIGQEKRGEVTAKCKEILGWLSTQLAQQEKKMQHEDPVITCAQMTTKQTELTAFATKIMSVPKPKPPAPEKKDEPPKEAKPEEKPDVAKPETDATPEATPNETSNMDTAAQ